MAGWKLYTVDAIRCVQTDWFILKYILVSFLELFELF